MSTTYVGELTLGVAIPLPVALVSQAQFLLQAQLDATIAMSANIQIPTTLANLIALAQSILNALAQMLALGIPAPSVSFQLSTIAAVTAQLALQLAPFLAFATLMAASGVFVYVYDGPTNGFGADMTAALSGGFPGHGATDHADVLVMGTVSGATWSAMQQVFKTSP